MSANDPKLIQISLQAIAKMIKFDLSQTGTETIGLLIGHESDGIVYIEDVRLGQQTGNAVHVEVSETELIQAATEISERVDGQVIVGWIHTHPNMGAFLSPTDIRTQSLYQSFMPNSVAIVVDPAKYGKTSNLDDLDLKVFRVINNQAKEHRYTFTKTVEFGLNSFVLGDTKVMVHGEATPKKYEVRIPTKETLRGIRMRIQQNRENLTPEDLSALESWLDLSEAIESGDIKEVPVEVDTLMGTLDNSLGAIKDEMISLQEEIKYRRAEKTLFFIILGLILEFSAFFFLFTR